MVVTEASWMILWVMGVVSAIYWVPLDVFYGLAKAFSETLV